MHRHDHRAPEVARLQSYFAEFAATHAELSLYSAISRAVATDAETASLLLAAAPGQQRPVLWLAALHDLVLRRPDLPGARWYPSIAGDRVASGDPWPDVRQTVLDHRDELTSVVATRTTQTNEVNRCVYLAAALERACADVPRMPVTLVEMGTSAGLLLCLDRYRIELRHAGGAVVAGDPGSSVRCAGEDRSRPLATDLALPRIAGRIGVDLHPVSLDDADGLRWLEACLWPDVAGRVERFRGAVEVARDDPPVVVVGDMVDDLEAVLVRVRAEVAEPSHVVVFSSWALTYVAAERRPLVGRVLGRLAAQGVPVSWVTAEPLGCVPDITLPPHLAALVDGTVLAVRRWRGGVECASLVLGTCHEHGAWLDLTT